jgi:ACT domain-containing protein
MSRRFLTSEDVRAAPGAEIVVDEATLVTPQAREAAAAAGIAIRTARGAWTEPRPDRGPDAPRAQEEIAHLPEPQSEVPGASASAPGASTSAIVTAVGKNRVGVLAEISAAIAAGGGSVLDVSQKVVEGLFHMVLMVEIGAASFAGLKQRLECMGGPDDYAVRVMHERVFRFMHRV